MIFQNIRPHGLGVVCFGILAMTQVVKAQSMSESLDQPDFMFTSSVSNTGIVFPQTYFTHDGVDAASFDMPSYLDQAALSTTVTGPICVSFWFYEWFSEFSYGPSPLTFTVDSVAQEYRSPENWTNIVVWLGPGVHSLKWAGTATGFDGSYFEMDQVEFTPVANGGIVHYVVQGSTNAIAPYTNWVTAASDIQSAVNAAANGESVLVSNGVYSSGGNGTTVVTIHKNITVVSVNGPSATSIDGQGRRCLDLGGFAVLDGFMIENGGASYSDDPRSGCGGGVLCCGATLRNCVVSGNSAQGHVPSEYGNPLSITASGGGVYCGSGLVENCVIQYNTAVGGNGSDSFSSSPCDGGAANGGGIYCNGCTMRNNLIIGNRSTGGNGNPSYGFPPVISGGGNGGAGIGGGVYIFSGTIQNSDIVANTAEGGYAINVAGSFGFADGVAEGGGTYGGTALNMVYFSNAPNDVLSTAIGYSRISSASGGEGNITNNPQFVNASGGNYRLRASSPCVDNGSNASVQGVTDLDRGPRIVNGQVDMGAFEFREQAAMPAVAGENVDFNWHVVTGCVYRFEYAENLTSSLWRSISGVTTAQTSTISIQDTNHLGQGFFRCVYFVP